jgi:hypothetical protein
MRDSIPKTINGNKAKLTWKYPENIIPKNKGASQYSVSSIYFMVFAQDENSMSDEIPVYSDLNIKVEKEDGTPIPKVEVIINQSDGKISFHNTDSSGMVKVKKLPPRNHMVKFPGSARIAPDGETVMNLNAAPPDRNIVALGSKVHIFKLIDLYMYCLHTIEWEGKVKHGESIEKMRRAVCNTNVFEVVPDYKGNDAYKDDIMILSRTATSLTANGNNLEKKPNEFGMHAFLLKCEQDSQGFLGAVPNILKKDFWTGLVKPKEYVVSGLPTPLTIKCYRSDLYKLQIKFPSMGGWSGGSKYQGAIKDVTNKVKTKAPKKFEHKPLPKGKGWDLKNWPESIHSDKSIIFQRNSVQIDTKFFEYVGAYIELANKLSEVVALVRENIPQIGFYFSWDCQVLQGTFVVEWGWKEYKDYRAYYYFGINFDIKLLEVRWEVGVGISGFSFKLQLFGAISGSISVSAKICKCSPDGEVELSIPFGGEIVGSIGARAEAGCFVKMEGTVELGFAAEDGALKFKGSEGLSASCNLKFSGLVGRLKISGGTAKKEGMDEQKSQSQIDEDNKEKRESITQRETDEKASSAWEHEIIKPKDLQRWEWSKEHKPEYVPAQIPADKLHDMMIKRLKENSIKVLIRTSMGFLDGDKYMEREDVAKGLEKVIHARNDIRKDPKTMEALSFEIKTYLLGKSQDNVVQQIDYFKFLIGKEFPAMLDKYKDPMQEIINENP